MPHGSTPGSSSDFYPASDDNEGAQAKQEKDQGQNDDSESQMDISGPEAQSPQAESGDSPGASRIDQKRKRESLASQSQDQLPLEATQYSLEPESEENARETKRRKASLIQQGTRTQGRTSDGLVGKLFYGLPLQVWQRILGYVPPIYLGRILRVSRLFNSALENMPKYIPEGLDPKVLDPGKVWRDSRRRFAPGLPKNLVGSSDLDMWRLLRGNGCQLCGEKLPLLTASNLLDPWQTNNDSDKTVRVVWPFGVRSCKACLAGRSEQERELLVSSTFPSLLLPALAFASLTQSQHYVLSITVNRLDRPDHIDIHRCYDKLQVESIRSRFANAKELGQGPVEEWLKGLDAEGTEKKSRITTWETWESKGGLNKINMRPGSRGPHVNIPKRNGTLPESHSGRSLPGINGTGSATSWTQSSAGEITSVSTFSGFSPSDGRSFHPTGLLPQRPSIHGTGARQERTLQDVNEAKAARRAEIERRCSILEKPITPNLLRHMDSFQAALVISSSLTDRAWEVLRPRLEAQREMAEEYERECAQQVQAIKAGAEDISKFKGEFSNTETKTSSEKEVSSIQAPLRDRLSKYAEEAIHTFWADGQAVTKENCPKFAADVLLHVRRRFLEDANQLDNTSRTENSNDAGLSGEKLILEHMKWVFDSKIKGYTEHLQRELFMCNGCEGSSKFYGFEAVIQHYAAKHTASLSQGSIVVHWRAEWPDPPPFNPNPALASNTFYAIPTPMASSPTQATNIMAPTPGHGELPGGLSSVVTPSHYGNFPGSYSLGYYSQYSVAPAMHPPSPNFSSYPPNTVPTGTYPHMAQPGGYLQQAHHQGNQIPPVAGYPAPMAGHNPYSPTVPSLGHPGMHLYHAQKEEMAKQARDVWFATSGVKDLPQSLRIFVVIHHVVARFEKKYTNEPGLSMFIDGLDHSATMRPVRSVNGLACKSCVTTTSGIASHDRKLYTLPLLLNHFRSVHVEKSQTTIDLQTGMEAARLDWKRDMIELPETHLVLELINATGINDEKLRLIASAIPGVFPEPLPRVGAMKSSGPFPKFGIETGGQTRFNYIGRSANGTPSGLQMKPNSDDRSPSTWSYHDNLDGSPTENLDIERARDDEYDPHRPGFFGRIMETHQVSHSMARPESSSLKRELLSEPTTHSVTHAKESGHYSNQLLRQLEGSSRFGSDQGDHLLAGSSAPSEGLSQHGTRAGSASRAVVDAEQFLRDFEPKLRDMGMKGDPRPKGDLSRPQSGGRADLGDMAARGRGFDSAYSPSGRESRPVANTTQYFPDNTYGDASPREMRRVKYVFADDGQPYEGLTAMGPDHPHTPREMHPREYTYHHRSGHVADNPQYERLPSRGRPEYDANGDEPTYVSGPRSGRNPPPASGIPLTYVPNESQTLEVDEYGRRVEYIPVHPNHQCENVVRYDHRHEGDSNFVYENHDSLRDPHRGGQHSAYDGGLPLTDRTPHEEQASRHTYWLYR